ncbi:unnamed protein product [Triticum turgidum subsp. durum]|uniref:Plant heme peroxidase family profile domain-containing protein n=1 Tax=Triticum turgidum subsp. durum TaxID=4567 RepID=A0A9R0ZG96_TRITD|nr:unnamed protein product [Triticum turgidum subsp. durum]
MASSSVPSWLALALLLLVALAATANGDELSPGYYEKTCPNVHRVVRSVMASSVAAQPRMVPAVLRLFFHDCFINEARVLSPLFSFLFVSSWWRLRLGKSLLREIGGGGIFRTATIPPRAQLQLNTPKRNYKPYNVTATGHRGGVATALSRAQSQLSTPKCNQTSGWRLQAPIPSTIASTKPNRKTYIRRPQLQLFGFTDEIQGTVGPACPSCDSTIDFQLGGVYSVPLCNSTMNSQVHDCPATVSCDDVIAHASRDAVALLGGPTWSVPLGRKDSRFAAHPESTKNGLPSPHDDLGELVTMFSRLNLDARDMTALSGAHTVGMASCDTYRDRVYGTDSDEEIDPYFAQTTQQTCQGLSGKAPFDVQTPMSLYGGGGLQDNLVEMYNTDGEAFARDFAKAMVKMGNVPPPHEIPVEVRLKCSMANNY